MDKRTTGALLGMVAGDAYINVRERLQSGKYPYASSEMRVLHSLQQRAYCEFKCSLLNKLMGRNSTVKEVANGPNGAYRAVHFSISHPYFKMLKGWTYTNGKKEFNQLWLDHLTLEGVAFWFMDDGSARRNRNKEGWVTSVATDIATCCSEAEANLICGWFWGEHRVRFRPFREKDYWSVRANTENSRQFANLVRPFVIEPMLYKLSHVADLSSHECRAPTGKCANDQCGKPIYDSRRKGLCSTCYSRRYYRQVMAVRG